MPQTLLLRLPAPGQEETEWLVVDDAGATDLAPGSVILASLAERLDAADYLSPFSDIVRPTTARSAPKRRRQKPSLRTTTRPPFGRSSATANVRPSATRAPKRRKKSALTWA